MLAEGYGESVVRRSAVVGVFALAAFGFNFLLLYLAARLLNVEGFGVLYLANTVANVLFAPAVIINLFLTRHLTNTVHAGGLGAGEAAFHRILRAVSLWGGGLALMVLAALMGAGSLVGIASPVIVALVVADAYTSYLADTARAVLQSRRQALGVGIYSVVWMGLRFMFCMVGILLTGTVWGGLIGVILSAVSVLGGFLWLDRNPAEHMVVRPPTPLAKLRIVSILPFAASYGVFVALSYLDILVAYLRLDEAQMGVYSASSVLPKAVLVATMPIMQMLFPILIGSRDGHSFSRPMAWKAGIVAGSAALGGSLTLYLGDSILCAGSLGVRSCSTVAMDAMLPSVIGLCLLRMLVLVQFARGHDRHPMLLAIGAAAWLALVGTGAIGTQALALSYDKFILAALVVYGLACFPFRRSPR